MARCSLLVNTVATDTTFMAQMSFEAICTQIHDLPAAKDSPVIIKRQWDIICDL